MDKKVLKQIRERDASYGENIPSHYQGPWDRRILLDMIDQLLKEVNWKHGDMRTELSV